MSKSLVGLFDSISVEVNDMITPEDKTFCEQTFSEYSLLIEQLNGYKAGLEALDKKLPQLNPAVLEEDDSYVHKNYHEVKAWHEPIAFTSTFNFLYIKKALDKALSGFVNRIVSHFNSKYNLDFKVRDEFEDDELSADWEVIVNRIIDYAGGSLVDAGIRKLKEDFKREFYFREDRKPEIKNNTITFPYAWLTSGRYISIYEKRPETLLRTLGYFETEATEIPDFIKKSFPLRTEDKMEYSAFRQAHEDCNKFLGFRYFKNNRLDLKFTNAIIAREFYDQFIEGG